jgi:hypothetical protein
MKFPIALQRAHLDRSTVAQLRFPCENGSGQVARVNSYSGVRAACSRRTIPRRCGQTQRTPTAAVVPSPRNNANPGEPDRVSAARPQRPGR